MTLEIRTIEGFDIQCPSCDSKKIPVHAGIENFKCKDCKEIFHYKAFYREAE